MRSSEQWTPKPGFLLLLELMLALMVWISSPTDLETNIWMQAVYLGGDPRKSVRE